MKDPRVPAGQEIAAIGASEVVEKDGSPDLPKLPKKGCLWLYAVWALFAGLVAGFILLTGGGGGEAAFFGIVLLVVPGAIVAGQVRGDRLQKRAAARLGFRRGQISRKGGRPPAPAFEAEASEADWHLDLLEGTWEGTGISIYDRTASGGRLTSTRRSPSRSLGVIWTLPGLLAPRLVVHGPTHGKTLVAAVGDSLRAASALSALPAIAPPSPVAGFERVFAAYGEQGAETLLTESVQRALLALPHRCRLAVEGPLVRWELERDNPFSRGLGRRAEELLRKTVPLRDALLEAAPLLS